MADCDWYDVGCHIGNATMSIAETIAQSFADAAETVIVSALTFWISVPTRPAEVDGGETDGVAVPNVSGDDFSTRTEAADLLGYATWIGLGVAVLSLIILGAMLAIARSRGEGGQYLGKIGVVLGAVALMSGAASIVTGLIGELDIGSANGGAGFLQSRLLFYVIIAATASVIFGGIKMVWEQRAEPGKELLKSLLTLVVVSAASITFINIGIGLGDEFSQWIITEATDVSDIGEMGASFVGVMGLASLAGSPGGLVLVILLGLIAIISGIIQIVLMLIREGMLILLTGVLPLTAAFTNTQMGKAWFQKAISWIVAFLLYKPVAALIYALAFVLMQTPPEGAEGGLVAEIMSVLVGVTMLLMAIFALPALMKFVTPMVGATAGGAMAGGAASMASQMPTGASGGSGGSKGGGSGGGGGGGGGGPTGGKNAPGGPGGGKAPSTGSTGGKPAASPGQGAATTAGSSAGSGAASTAAKSNPKTAAIYAAAEAAKKVGEQAKKGVDDTASGGEGPSGSK